MLETEQPWVSKILKTQSTSNDFFTQVFVTDTRIN